MGLDTERLHKLRSKGFHELYNRNEARWVAIVEDATKHAATFVKGEGDRVRPADVAALVEHAVRIDQKFEEHVQSKRLQQKYWIEYFAEYCVEQKYPAPEIAPEGDGGSA